MQHRTRVMIFSGVIAAAITLTGCGDDAADHDNVAGTAIDQTQEMTAPGAAAPNADGSDAGRGNGSTGGAPTGGEGPGADEDARFLDALARHDVEISDPGEAVAVAKQYCTDVSDGAGMLEALERIELDATAQGVFASTAITVYCPDAVPSQP